jgi:hypothetical protein
VTPPDPIEAWRALRPNSLIWARWWLENGGELPAACHHVIRAKLAPWIAAVTEGGPEMRDALLTIVPPIPSREPEQARAWIMPAIGKTYSMEREPDEADQVKAQSAAEPAEVPEKPIGADRGCVTREPADVRHPPAPVTPQQGGVVPSTPRRHQVCGVRKGVQTVPGIGGILFRRVQAARVP